MRAFGPRCADLAASGRAASAGSVFIRGASRARAARESARDVGADRQATDVGVGQPQDGAESLGIGSEWRDGCGAGHAPEASSSLTRDDKAAAMAAPRVRAPGMRRSESRVEKLIGLFAFCSVLQGLHPGEPCP